MPQLSQIPSPLASVQDLPVWAALQLSQMPSPLASTYRHTPVPVVPVPWWRPLGPAATALVTPTARITKPIRIPNNVFFILCSSLSFWPVISDFILYTTRREKSIQNFRKNFFLWEKSASPGLPGEAVGDQLIFRFSQRVFI